MIILSNEEYSKLLDVAMLPTLRTKEQEHCLSAHILCHERAEAMPTTTVSLHGRLERELADHGRR